MKLIMIRHGESEHNKLMREMTIGARKDTGIASPVDSRDLPLTDEGREQIVKITEKIPQGKIVLFCGNHLRTKESAAIIAEITEVSVTVEPRINAAFSGSLDHKSFDEMKEITGIDFQKQVKDGTYDFSAWGGESSVAVTERVRQFLREACESSGDDAVVVAVASVESITPVYDILFGRVSPTLPRHIRVRNGSLHEFNITKDMI